MTVQGDCFVLVFEGQMLAAISMDRHWEDVRAWAQSILNYYGGDPDINEVVRSWWTHMMSEPGHCPHCGDPEEPTEAICVSTSTSGLD